MSDPQGQCLAAPQALPAPTYKQRVEEFKKLFRELPESERLIMGELRVCVGVREKWGERGPIQKWTLIIFIIYYYYYHLLKTKDWHLSHLHLPAHPYYTYLCQGASRVFPQTIPVPSRETSYCRDASTCQRTGSVSIAMCFGGQR
jgi:hypothetical protein